MKYKKFHFLKDFTWFFPLVSVVITINSPEYATKNLSFQIHWLGLHLKWFWEKESDGEE